MKEGLTDRFIFERFMDLMDMVLAKEYKRGENTVLIYDDYSNPTYYRENGVNIRIETNVSKNGYDDFNMGAEFDKNGAMIRGYMDCNVVGKSEIAAILDIG